MLFKVADTPHGKIYTHIRAKTSAILFSASAFFPSFIIKFVINSTTGSFFGGIPLSFPVFGFKIGLYDCLGGRAGSEDVSPGKGLLLEDDLLLLLVPERIDEKSSFAPLLLSPNQYAIFPFVSSGGGGAGVTPFESKISSIAERISLRGSSLGVGFV